jgi:hypothetical protein
MLMQGTADWRDYEVSARVRVHMAAHAGIGARVQGMRRYYALLLGNDGKVRLVKALDGERVLAEKDFPWQTDAEYELSLKVVGNRLRGAIDGEALFDVEDDDRPLEAGAAALVCEEGRLDVDVIRVRPAR